MGWTASYQVLRDQTLTAAELAAIAELVRRQRKLAWDSETFHLSVAPQARPDRVVADGMTKMSMDPESGDSDLLAAAITELAALVPNSEVRVADDFGRFGWDPARGCVLGSRRRGVPLIHVPYGELVDPTTLVPAPPVAIDPALDVPGLVALFATLDTYDQKCSVSSLFDARDPVEVATTIYRHYATIGRDDAARNALWRALERIADPSSVAPVFLAAWCAGSGTYFYGDMPLPNRFREGIAQVPEAVEQFIADLAATERAGDDELTFRRAEVALDLLARSQTDRSLRAILELVRNHRGKTIVWRMQLYVVDRAHEVLALHGDVRVVPTLLHYLGTMTRMHRAHTEAIRAVVALAPDRARPHVLALAASGIYGNMIAEPLVALGGADTIEPLRRLAIHTESSTRDIAAASLRRLGEEPPTYVQRSLEDLAVDPDQRTRSDALRALAERKDKSTFVSLVLAEALDKYLRARVEDPALPFSWWDWRGVVPDFVIEGNTAQKMAWANSAGRHVLGPQTIWPSVAKILEVGPGAVEATYPPSVLAFDGAMLAALIAEENQILASLRSS